MKRVLGVDLASGKWSDVGTAVITFDEVAGRFASVDVPGLSWPRHRELTPLTLAEAVLEFALSSGISAVALDGPQGWRDPATPAGTPGVGRRCEHLCHTQGRMGVHPRTYPGTQRRFFEFSVDVFDALLRKPGVVLANESTAPVPVRDGYVLLECYPTSAWRSSGLNELPGKGKRPIVKPWTDGLQGTYALPGELNIASHDDLQALVAALCAVGVVGGPVDAIPEGVPAWSLRGQGLIERRVEGIIWNVRSLAPVVPVVIPTAVRLVGRPPAMTVASTSAPAIRVTQKVVDHVSETSIDQQQIACHGLPEGSRLNRTLATVVLRDNEYPLVLGDTSAIWRSHQTEETLDGFEYLFATLADEPDTWVPVEVGHLQ